MHSLHEISDLKELLSLLDFMIRASLRVSTFSPLTCARHDGAWGHEQVYDDVSRLSPLPLAQRLLRCASRGPVPYVALSVNLTV